MRKQWTPKTEITPELLESREKRKWQIALRRYLIEKKAGSYSYAPYFGLPIAAFRNWLELQFDESLNWENFSSAWQLEHIIPVSYFDLSIEKDLYLCWNFTNIMVKKTTHPTEEFTVLSAKNYYQQLYDQSGYKICLAMLQKLQQLETLTIPISNRFDFFKNNQQLLTESTSFSIEDYARLNEGTLLTELLAEKALLKRFGS